MGNVKIVEKPYVPVVVAEELCKMTPEQRQFTTRFLVAFREHAKPDVKLAFDEVLAEMGRWERDHAN